eukprot:3241790-Pleurochrysis_carterae.AAC.1
MLLWETEREGSTLTQKPTYELSSVPHFPFDLLPPITCVWPFIAESRPFSVSSSEMQRADSDATCSVRVRVDVHNAGVEVWAHETSAHVRRCHERVFVPTFTSHKRPRTLLRIPNEHPDSPS